MKIQLNLINLLNFFTLIPPIILFIILFTVQSFSVTIAIPLIFIDPNAAIGLIPLTQNLTIWDTSIGWLYLTGLIIWIVSAGLFLVSNIKKRNFKKIAYYLGVPGWILPNIALIGDTFIYNIVSLTLTPLILTVGFSVISAVIGIYIKISD